MISAKKDLVMLQKGNNITVAIYMICYNHEDYIEKTIESVMMQQTNFHYKLFLGEDCSPDRTRALCIALKNKYPTKIDLLLHTKNIGATLNAVKTFKLCFDSNSKYVAMCEGDDYWTDPLKLQKQVDFLEQHEDYSICFHPVKVYNQTQQQFVDDTITKKVEPTTTLKELSIENYIHTPSVVFRNNLVQLPSWFINTPIGDYPLYCLLGLKGKIFKMEDKMAVYRVHDKGAMASFKKNNLIKRIGFNNGMIPFYEYMYQQSNILNFRKKLIHLLYANQSYAIQENNVALTKSFTKKLLKEHLFYLNFTQFISTITSFFFSHILKKRYEK